MSKIILTQLVIFFALVGVLCAAAIHFVGSWSCSSLHRETGIETKFTSAGCYVRVRGQWVPRQNWRVE